MSWRTLIAADVQTQLSGEELEKLQTAVLADGQADPLPGIITQVTDEVRGYVGGHSGNALGTGSTLPPQVIGAAIAIVRWRLCGRLAIGGGAALLQTPQRQKDYEDALEFLKAVRKGEIAVEQPESVATETLEGELGRYGGKTKVDFSV
jgi:phage gp36-like protein